MLEVINIAVVVVPVVIISFMGSCYFGFTLVYTLARESLKSLLIFGLIILTIVLVPIITPFRWDSNLLLILWSAWSGAVIPFGFFLFILIEGLIRNS